MKCAFILWFAFVASANAQGTFENLNFKQASVSGPPPAQLSTAIALPGWQVYLNGSPAGIMGYDDQPLDGWAVSIVDAQFHLTGQIPISGRFSVYMNTGRDFFGNRGAGEIAQTGAVPSDSRSLLFAVQAFHGVPTVSFNGQGLSAIPFQSNAASTTYAADITQYAGQTGELRFTAPFTGLSPETIIDDIQFSPQIVPEPSTVALIAAGAVVLGALFLPRQRPVLFPGSLEQSIAARETDEIGFTSFHDENNWKLLTSRRLQQKVNISISRKKGGGEAGGHKMGASSDTSENQHNL